MAKVNLNPILLGMSGRVGNIVFKKTSTGGVYVSRHVERSNRQPSAAQQAHRERFRQAAAYAKAAMADPHLRTHYEEQSLRSKKPARALAIADYMQGRNLLNPVSLPRSEHAGLPCHINVIAKERSD